MLVHTFFTLKLLFEPLIIANKIRFELVHHLVSQMYWQKILHNGTYFEDNNTVRPRNFVLFHIKTYPVYKYICILL